MKGKSAKSLQAFLDSELKGVKLIEIEDERGYTLLHIAAFKKFSNDFESILCGAIRKQKCSDEEMLEYVNRQTSNDDGYTALHLASYHGNYLGIQFLISIGADPQKRSKQSLSVLHMASQGESPYAFLLREIYP